MSTPLYLLTGATGLLGGNLVRALSESGKHIRALVMRGDPATASLPQGVDVVEGDLLDEAALDRFFAAGDAVERIVIHAASIVTMDPRPNEKVHAVNVVGTRNIVERCIRHDVKKLVYVSSTSVIPEPQGGQLIVETDCFDPTQVIGFYAVTKTMATELVMRAARERGLDASVVCPSGIFGPNDYGFGLITSSILMVAKGRLPVTIGGTFNSVDARDLAQGILACVEKGRKGEIYIMASQCYTFTDLVEAIQSAVGSRKRLPHISLGVVRPFVWIGSLYSRLTHRPAWLSSYTIYNLQRNNNYSYAKAERELDFHCRPLGQSITDTIVWLEQVGKLVTKHASKVS